MKHHQVTSTLKLFGNSLQINWGYFDWILGQIEVSFLFCTVQALDMMQNVIRSKKHSNIDITRFLNGLIFKVRVLLKLNKLFDWTTASGRHSCSWRRRLWHLFELGLELLNFILRINILLGLPRIRRTRKKTLLFELFMNWKHTEIVTL